MNEIFESFDNGQKKQFCKQVSEYGLHEFIEGLDSEIDSGIITIENGYAMLKTYLTIGA